MKKIFLAFSLINCFCFAKEQVNLLISKEEILERIAVVADQINHDYKDEELTIVMIMKGAICITADLIKKIEVPFTLECVKAASYGCNGTKRGELTITGVDSLALQGRNILVVDDIFDSGHTMSSIVNLLKEHHPKSIKSLVLLLKQTPRTISYLPDYSLFSIEDSFVIGYGLDYKEYYRGLDGIYILNQ